MINRNKFILFLLFLLIIAIPVSFAGDVTYNETSHANYETDSLDLNISQSNSDDTEILGANDVYFDSSAQTDGSGSQSSPYKYLSSSKVGAVNHFAPGTYTINSGISSIFMQAMTFIGEDRDSTVIQYTGSDAFITTGSDLTFSTITLKGVNIVSTGGLLTATNTVFDSGKAQVELEADNTYYDNSYGGAIKQKISSSGSIDWSAIFGGGSSSTGMKIDNCIFKNNFAAYGGAIYVEGGTTEITNTQFESNHATNYGGAIAGLDGAKITLTNCEFDNDYSSYDAGGAVYVYNSTLNADKNSFNDCTATFGCGVTSLESTTSISNSNFRRNKASWEGGAIYAMYGSLSVLNSNFLSNEAKNGGAIFADNLTYFKVNGGEFKNNIADDTGGAIFSFANKVNEISTTYLSNTAYFEDNLYQSDKIELILGSDDYEMIQYKSDYNGILPSKYDLRTNGGVTPVENQGQSGNCWAFATIATLESAILKATGKQYDLSEGNLKNVATKFSDIGWAHQTNAGGMYPFSIGYLTSWAGPINASSDPTDDWDLLGPILNSVVHVQNILYLQRTSFTDNNAIKEAIMKYGAVCSEIYWSNSYLSGNNYYYYGEEARNHAISVVGWDDTKSISGAPGSGAWIIKNSYGPTRGDGGYYYVSYYDKSLFRVYDESYNSFAIIFNDTVRFNKNYQYDPSFTDYFLTGETTMWYKNSFISTGNDILSAFSTYFRKVTDWEAQVFVNDELKLTQTGKTNFGYYTINLNEAIPLKIGDKFTISLKISCSSSADIPISESGLPFTINKEYFKPGVSFFSKDGKTWTDFYGYTATYGSGETGHNYYSQVACLKAFTTHGIKEVLNTTISIVNVTSTGVKVNVFSQNGDKINTGRVEFIIDDDKYYSGVSNSNAEAKVYLTPGNHKITVTYIENSAYNSSTTSKNINLAKENPIITIETEDINYGNDLNVKVILTNAIGEEVNIPVLVEINGKNYTQNQITISNLNAGTYTIKVKTESTTVFNSNTKNKSVKINKITPTLNLQIDDVKIGQNITVKVTLSNNINGSVNVVIGTQNHVISVKNGEGSINVENTLSSGKHVVTGNFTGNSNFNSVKTTKLLNVGKITPIFNILSNDISEGSNASVIVYVPEDLTDNITLSINSVTYSQKTVSGVVIFNISGLTYGNHKFTIKYSGDGKYNSKTEYGTLKVSETTKEELELNVTATVNGRKAVINVELPSDVAGDVILNINSKTYNKTPVDGKTSFTVIDLKNGEYVYIVSFKGDEKYKSNLKRQSLTINVKDFVLYTIIAENMIRAYLSSTDFKATFTDEYGNVLKNRDVTFVIDGREYIVKTNQFGVAKLNTQLKVGNYNVTVINTQTHENITRQINIVDRIIENKDIKMDYNDGSVFKVRVVGDNGKVVGAYEKVVFKLNGKEIIVLTDKNGFASIKLDLTPKTYTIETKYRGVSSFNKIIVKQVLKTKNLSKKKAKKIKFTATLKTSKGKAIAGKKITFKLNGKTYTAKTNKKGVATITLKNLKVGKYKITSTYLKTTLKNTIKIKR